MIALFDVYGNMVEETNVTTSIINISAPTAGFAIKLKEYMKYGEYFIVATSKHFPPIHKRITVRR